MMLIQSPRRLLLAVLLPITLFIAFEAHAQGGPLNIQTGTLKIAPFRLESGVEMPEIVIAYETYGTMAPDGRNAVLLSHGFTSSHHFAGRGEGDAEGSWNALIGPGKAIDTDTLFVVSPNHLGSSFGSTSPAHTNPATGKPYGPDFPVITTADMVNAQKALLDGLGVKRLVAVIGPSYGGRHVFQWGVTHPDFVDGLVPVVSGPKDPRGPAGVQSLINQLSKDPNWNGGWYYDKGGILSALTAMRIATLKSYGIDEQLAAKFPDAAQREAEIARVAGLWAQLYDGNSLIVLRRANVGIRHRKGFPQDEGQGALRPVTH